MHRLNEVCKAIRDCKELTLQERRKAIKAYKVNLKKYAAAVGSPAFNSSTLGGSFIFACTPEGHEYWGRIQRIIGERG